jgi:glutamate-5-semialdehyde dehydrogenase
VFRIGSDALGTATALVEHAVRPALAEAGLPAGAVSLVASEDRAAGWALFADDRLALAVARGSGAAVAQLGGIARRQGTPVSLHGTGGAWMLVTPSADRRARRGDGAQLARPQGLQHAERVLRRAGRRRRLVPVVLGRSRRPRRAGRSRSSTSSCATTSERAEVQRVVGPGWFDRTVASHAPSGPVPEVRAEELDVADLGPSGSGRRAPSSPSRSSTTSTRRSRCATPTARASSSRC